MRVRRHLRLGVRVTLSVALVALVLWWADAAAVGATLGGASLPGALLVVVLHTLDRMLMAFKWQRLLLARGHALGLGQAIRSYYVSSFVGVFLPMTVGADVVRVAALQGQGNRVTGSALIASIAVERALGALSQAVFCMLSVLLIVSLQLQARIALGTLLLAAAAVLAGLSLLVPLSFRIAEQARRWLHGRSGMAGRLEALAAEYAGWREHPGAMWSFLLLTFVEGFFPILTYLAAARALGVETTLVQMAALVPIVYLIARMPVPVALIGFEQGGFVVAASALLGMNEASAAAISFLVSPITLLLALLPGALAYVLMRKREL